MSKSVEQVQTKTQIRQLLERIGARPQKRLGQNFLIDGNLMRRLAESARIDPNDVILEIGAGTGGLTDLLLRRAARVITVEIDKRLARLLADRYADEEKFILLVGDALKNKNTLSPAVIQALQTYQPAVPGKLMLVANLPYVIATPLLIDLLLSPVNVSRFCFTVQKEVAERITADPGCKAYGPLSIIIQTACHVETLAIINPHAFWPAPKVESAMMRLDVRDPLSRHDLARLAAVVRSLFLHRRKTLRHNIATTYGLEAVERISDSIDLDLSTRPESLDPKTWTVLADLLQPPRSPDGAARR